MIDDNEPDLFAEELTLNEEERDDKDYNEAIAIRAKVNRLRENDDFKWLTAVMQSNLDARVLAVFTEIKGIDGAITNLARAAEIRGFQAALLFPQSLFNGAEGLINSYEALANKRK